MNLKLEEIKTPTIDVMLRDMFGILNGYPAWLTRIPEGDTGWKRQAEYNDYSNLIRYTIWFKFELLEDEYYYFAVLQEESLQAIT